MHVSLIVPLFFLKEFMKKKPSLLEMESDIQHYDSIEIMIDKIESLIILESIELSTGKKKTTNNLILHYYLTELGFYEINAMCVSLCNSELTYNTPFCINLIFKQIFKLICVDLIFPLSNFYV